MIKPPIFSHLFSLIEYCNIVTFRIVSKKYCAMDRRNNDIRMCMGNKSDSIGTRIYYGKRVENTLRNQFEQHSYACEFQYSSVRPHLQQNTKTDARAHTRDKHTRVVFADIFSIKVLIICYVQQMSEACIKLSSLPVSTIKMATFNIQTHGQPISLCSNRN